MLMHPGHHLVSHEQAKLLLELSLTNDQQKAPQPLRLTHLWLSQTTTDRHNTCSQYALSEDRPEQVLHVRSKSEGHSVVRSEQRVGIVGLVTWIAKEIEYITHANLAGSYSY